MNNVKPVAVLVRERNIDWKIELRTLKGCQTALGEDLLNAFCRCFVQTDRLISLIGLAYLSGVNYETSSRGFVRNLQTTVWFTVGTLRELVLAIRALRRAAAKRNVLDVTGEPWRALRALEERWEGDPFFRNVRKIAAFRVDQGLVDRGLIAMEETGDAILCEGRGNKLQDASMRLGLDAVFNGAEMSLVDCDRFMKAVSEDRGISIPIQEAFLLALEAVGIPLEEADGSAA